MNKTYSMSIRVSEEELSKLKRAAKLESYSSYSECLIVIQDSIPAILDKCKS